LSLKTQGLPFFQLRLTTAYFEGGSLKKSPKYFPCFSEAKLRQRSRFERRALSLEMAKQTTRRSGADYTGAALTDVA
jgi:hypothetical protein